MDMTWVTDRIAVGGGIWNADNMADVAGAGVTHIVDMQAEFDDTSLAESVGVKVLWNPVEDDFQPKPAEVFQRGVEFVQEALDQDQSKIYHSLRGRSSSCTDDDAGSTVLHRLEAASSDAYDRKQTSGCRFCRSICRERGKIFKSGRSLGPLYCFNTNCPAGGASVALKRDNKAFYRCRSNRTGRTFAQNAKDDRYEIFRR